MRSRDVLMCRSRYAEETPFLLRNTQLPPTRSDSSKQSNGMPRSFRALAPAIPEEPAPITQTRGSLVMAREATAKLTRASSLRRHAGDEQREVVARLAALQRDRVLLDAPRHLVGVEA